MFGIQPFTEVNQLAAVGTERSVFPREPVAGLLARRAFDRAHGLLGFGGNLFEVGDNISRIRIGHAGIGKDFFHVIEQRLRLRG